MQDKSSEMDVLMKARLADFKESIGPDEKGPAKKFL